MSTQSISPGPRQGFRWRPLAFYTLMLIGTVAAFLVIRTLGESIPTIEAVPPTTATATDIPTQHRSEALLHVLLALVAMIVAGQVLGRLFAYLHQPPVIGEVVAGILLGPSLLGLLAPDVYAYVLPADIAPYLGIVAQLGVVLYMFIVGLELDTSVLREKGHATIAISQSGKSPDIVGKRQSARRSGAATIAITNT